MAGHSKWANIKHKKAAADKKKGKVFSRLAKEVTVAARAGGGDIDMNPALRAAVQAAKAANMPNDNIDRAIKKGTGELGGGTMEELVYEGYAAGGVAVLASCLTDNRNRTAANVRAIFTRCNGNLAGNGAVSWMFQRKAEFIVTQAAEDAVLETLMEADAEAEEITGEDGDVRIVTAPAEFGEVLQALEDGGYSCEGRLVMLPDNTTEVTELAAARQVIRLIDALEEDDDVQEVTSNLELSDEVAEKLDEE